MGSRVFIFDELTIPCGIIMSSRNQHEEHNLGGLEHGPDGSDHDDHPEPPVDQQPRFTKDDEQRELASLSIDDIFKIQADLMGIDTITGGLSGLGLDGSTAPNPFPADICQPLLGL